MRKRMMPLLGVCVALIVVSGCATLGPEPDRPEDTIRLQIDSIPSGADIYTIAKGGGALGTKIGRTPTTVNIGVARQYMTDGRPCNWNVWFWAPDGLAEWKMSPDGKKQEIVVNFAVLKDGYYPQTITDRRIGPFETVTGPVFPWPPDGFSITVPLRRIESDVTRPPQQQQQQQQQQTVVIPGSQGEAQQTGTVMVTSSVQDADVYVDGIFVGNTPANLKLKDGIHIIEVKKSGYSTYRKELRVFGGSELSLRAELTK